MGSEMLQFKVGHTDTSLHTALSHSMPSCHTCTRNTSAPTPLQPSIRHSQAHTRAQVDGRLHPAPACGPHGCPLWTHCRKQTQPRAQHWPKRNWSENQDKKTCYGFPHLCTPRAGNRDSQPPPEPPQHTCPSLSRSGSVAARAVGSPPSLLPFSAWWTRSKVSGTVGTPQVPTAMRWDLRPGVCSDSTGGPAITVSPCILTGTRVPD